MFPENANVGVNSQLRNSSNVMSASSQQIPLGVPGLSSGNPPPLPPRQTNYTGYNDYRPLNSSYYGGYGYGGYRGYGSYGSFGGYSPYSGIPSYSGYSPYNMNSGDIENRFLQYAEESTRSTFHFVETILQTFSSVTMMMESTYFAMTNSFRAILSVAENIGRLRSTFGQLLSTFALIRYMKWIYRRLKYHIFGIHDPNFANEELWQRSLTTITNGEKTTTSSLSALLFFGLFIIIPYLIHRIVTNVKQTQVQGTDPEEWTKCNEPVYTANALYNFVAASSEELSLKSGQKVWIAPQSLQPKNAPGWWRATDSVRVGLIPSNYVAIVGQLKKKSEQGQTAQSTAGLHSAGTSMEKEDSVSRDTRLDNVNQSNITLSNEENGNV